MGLRTWLARTILGADTTGDWFVAFRDAIEANKVHAGVSVTHDTALSLPAVYRCWSLNSDTVATTPIDVIHRTANNRRQPATLPPWLAQPNDDMDLCEFLGQAQASLEADGNAMAIKAVTRNGQLAALYPLNPLMVDVERDADKRIVYDVRQDDGTAIRLQANEVWHVKAFTMPGALRGLSPIGALRQTIGLGMAAQQFGAQFFGTGANLSGVIEIPGPDPGEDGANRLQKAFTRKHGGLSKSHALGVLFGGAKWVPLSVKPEEAQFLETRRYTDVQIANAYGVPPEYVTDIEGAKGFVTGLYARQYMWLLTGINPRFTRIENKLTALLPGNLYAKFNRNAFLAMDPSERKDFYGAGLRDRWLVPNEVREKEDMDPLPGGDVPLWSVQWQDGMVGGATSTGAAKASLPTPEGGEHAA